MSAPSTLRAITTEEREQIEAVLMGVAARIDRQKSLLSEAQRIAETPKKKRRKEK